MRPLGAAPDAPVTSDRPMTGGRMSLGLYRAAGVRLAPVTGVLC
ncbi:hypothetical protein [Modestobacter lapidis]